MNQIKLICGMTYKEEDYVYDWRIPEEDVLPANTGNSHSAWNQTMQHMNNCVNQQPVYVQVAQYKEKFDAGESLCVKGNETMAVSEGRTTLVADGVIRNRLNYSIRSLYEGEITSCKRVRYDDEGGVEFFYEITTKGCDGNVYNFEIGDFDLDKKLFKILSEKGKLKFKKHRKDKGDEEWLSCHIAGTAVEDDLVYPYFPQWKNGSYIYSDREHIAETPFFKNIIKVEHTNEKELEILRKVMDSLKVFKSPSHRLFFLIISAYSVLQSRIPYAIKIGVPFAVNVSNDWSCLVEPYLDIFSAKAGACCGTDEDVKQVDLLKQNRKGTVVFYENRTVTTAHYKVKAENNLEHIVTNHDKDTVEVIVNKNPAGYVFGAFNVLIKDDDIDAEEYQDVNYIKEYLSKFMIGFVEWIGESEINVEGTCKLIYGDDKYERCLKVIYALLKDYNNAISEKALAEKFGFDNEEEVLKAIEKLCADKDCYSGGEWILERLGDIYRALCSRGECKKVFLKRDSEIEFDDGVISFIEKDDMLCIREHDMKHLVQVYMPELTFENVKVALLEADALVCDKHQTYLKNIHIPSMNKTIRFIAIKKAMLKSTGEINL